MDGSAGRSVRRTAMQRTDVKKPTGSSNSTAGRTDTPMLSDTTDTGKAFPVLAARFALAGNILTRCSPADGAGVYYAAHWGMSRALPDLQAAAQFLVQIGGAA